MTCRFELVTRGFELKTRGIELVNRGFGLVTRVLLFHVAGLRPATLLKRDFDTGVFLAQVFYCF